MELLTPAGGTIRSAQGDAMEPASVTGTQPVDAGSSTPSPDKLRIAVEALEAASYAFDAIRRTLIAVLDEPGRTAFWAAVHARVAADATLKQLQEGSGDAAE